MAEFTWHENLGLSDFYYINNRELQKEDLLTLSFLQTPGTICEFSVN